MDITKLKSSITDKIDESRQQLTDLCLKIHANPELGFQEYKAAQWLTEHLSENGFTVERNIGDLPTAFRATYGEGLPAIAVLAEYDALPEVGHACGHNLIATSAVAAGIAAAIAVSELGGSVVVIGTPAEELYGGKILMAERGTFDHIDIAMMVHPGVQDLVTIETLACQTLDVEFFGREAHAAAQPEAGINALEAMVQSFTAINSLRQHTSEKSRIHGIITDGGQAANIVPAHSAGNFLVRAETDDYLDELKQKVINCFSGAAIATGARLEYRWAETRYAAMRNNLTLARLFQQNMQSLGRATRFSEPGFNFGSTDMGNVSKLVPSIHPFVAIAPNNVIAHSPDFARAAASPAGIQGLIDAAKAMAMTIADLLADKEMITMAREEFVQKK